MAENIQIQQNGQRIYIVGHTYPIRDRLRSAGAHWDGDRGAWWIGAAKRADIESVIAAASAAAASQGPDRGARVLGRARYRDREYYVLAKSRDGRRLLLAFRDGSKQFWADASEATLIRRYDSENYRTGRVEYPTLGYMLDRAAEWRAMSPEERERRAAIRAAGGVCRCDRPLDEGGGECMKCGYAIVD
jgi:hypothetical protein